VTTASCPTPFCATHDVSDANPAADTSADAAAGAAASAAASTSASAAAIAAAGDAAGDATVYATQCVADDSNTSGEAAPTAEISLPAC